MTHPGFSLVDPVPLKLALPCEMERGKTRLIILKKKLRSKKTLKRRFGAPPPCSFLLAPFLLEIGG